jgi:flagellar basal body-associated protein FliL
LTRRAYRASFRIVARVESPSEPRKGGDCVSLLWIILIVVLVLLLLGFFSRGRW